MNDVKLRWTPRDLSEITRYRNDALIGRHIKSTSAEIEDARDGLDGLKQFLYICAAVPGAHAPSAVVATMWHSFLISSKDYRDFCHGYLGRFIDHRTLETPCRETYLATRHAAEGVFGQLDEKIWPASADGASHDDKRPEPLDHAALIGPAANGVASVCPRDMHEKVDKYSSCADGTRVCLMKSLSRLSGEGDITGLAVEADPATSVATAPQPLAPESRGSAWLSPWRRPMALRTSRKTITFTRPFSLRGVDGVQPAGTYTVETDEELLEGLSFPAYRRVATLMFVPSQPGGAVWGQLAEIDPVELQAAQERDAIAG